MVESPELRWPAAFFLLQVLVNEGEAPELGSEHRILRPLENRESHRITPNPAARLQPIFVDAAAAAAAAPSRGGLERRGKQRPRLTKGLCLEISGRVQHSSSDLQRLAVAGGAPDGRDENAADCSHDYD